MYKKLFECLKPYKWQLIFACFFIIAESLLEILVPFLMNFIIQNGGGITYDPITQEVISIDMNYVIFMGCLMIGCAILAFIFGIVGSKLTAIAGRGLGAEIRKRQYRKIQEFSFDNLDYFRTSSLITRLTNDVTIIQDSFCQSFRPALRAPIMLIFSMVFAFVISPYLGLVFIVVIPILAVLLIIILKKVSPKFRKLQKIVDKLNRTTQESIVAIRTIKAYVKEDYESEKFQNVNRELVNTSSSAFATISVNMPIMQFMTYCTIISLLLFGAHFFTQGVIKDVANISTFLSYITQLLASLQMLSNVFMMINRSNISVQRTVEVLNTTSEIKNNINSPLMIKNGNVILENVSFKYQSSAKELVLSNINMNIKSGEFIGIVGQTGSGKTTLISLIERFYDASSGKIIIGDNDIKEYSLEELHDKIAISFQNPLLFSGTILENLKWGNKNASMEEIIRACKIACCYDFINEQLPNGFNTIIGQSGTNVSGGQRQRLCLARAILKQPKILILDDSFSALDRITEKRIKENIKNELQDITKIVISQKISAIKEADRIFVIDNGKISHFGKHDELLENDEIYRTTYLIQNEGGLE